MATSLNAQAQDTHDAATNEDLAITLGGGTNRKLVVFVGISSADFTIASVTFEPAGSNLAVGAISGNGSPDRLSFTFVQLFEADIADGESTGAKVVRVIMSSPIGTGGTLAWIINGGATGALEDIQFDSEDTSTDILSATLTNASLSYVGCGIFNAAVSADASFSGGGLTEWNDTQTATGRIWGADATSDDNVVCHWDATSTSNRKIMIGWAVAEAGGGGAPPITPRSIPRAVQRGVLRAVA